MSVQITIETKEQINAFSTIIGNVHRFSENINLDFNEKRLFVQGLDATHVCIYELRLLSTWFTDYDVSSASIVCIKCAVLNAVMQLHQEHQQIKMSFDENSDKFDISFINSPQFPEEIPREFGLPIMNIEQECLEIPDCSYTASFEVESKTFANIINPLLNFSDVLEFMASKTSMYVTTNSEDGRTTQTIMYDKEHNACAAKKYVFNSSDEMDEFTTSFSLKYLQIFCAFHKLCKMVHIYITKDVPIRVEYLITNKNDTEQYLRLYLAPKIDDC